MEDEIITWLGPCRTVITMGLTVSAIFNLPISSRKIIVSSASSLIFGALIFDKQTPKR